MPTPAAHAAVLLASLLFSITGASAWTRVDTMLTMSDGVEIAVTYFAPSLAPPPQGHPAVLLMHGFDVQGNAKGVFTGFGGAGAARADSGYFSVAFSMRGMGDGENASGGEFDWFTGPRELEDLREIIAWTAARGDVDGERIAIEGFSQGGLMAWAAAIAKLPVRCIVPMVSVPSFSKSFLADGGFNYLVQTFLRASSILRQNIRLGPFLGDTLMRAFREDRYEDARGLVERRDLAGREAEVEIPVFMQCAWHDDIFSSAEALRSFARLRSPKKILMWPGPHGWPFRAFTGVRDEMTYRFLRRWLRDDEAETIMHADSAVSLIDGATVSVHHVRADDERAWLPIDGGEAAPERLHLSNGGTLSPTPPAAPVIEVRMYVKGISDDSVVFVSEPLGADRTYIAGRVRLVAGSSAGTYQANMLLWDYDPATDTREPIMRGCQQRRGNDPAVRDTIIYELEPQLYTVRAGHRIEAWVKFGTSTTSQILGIPLKPDNEFGCALFAPQESASDTLFSGADASSFVELYPFEPRPTAVESPELVAAGESLTSSPTVARGGASITLTRRAPVGTGPSTLELVALDGRVLRRRSFPTLSWTTRVETVGLAAGVYLLRSGGATTRVAVMH